MMKKNIKVKKQKKESFIKNYLSIICLLVVVFVLGMFLGSKISVFNLKGNISGARSGSTFTKIFNLGTKDHKFAIQGATFVDNKIYYTTVDSDKNNSIWYYDLDAKEKVKTTAFDKTISNLEKKGYFINDAVTANSRNYYMMYRKYTTDNDKSMSSKIMYSEGGNVKTINLKKDGKDFAVANIAYRTGTKKFYSVKIDKTNKNIILYEYSIPNNLANNSDVNVKKIKVYSILENANDKEDVDNISLQGITIKKAVLYVSYIVPEYHSKIVMYDLVLENNKPLQKIQLSYNDSNNCEIENLFFKGSKMYVSYNNKAFRSPSVYRYSYDSSKLSLSYSLTKKINSNKITLSYASADNNIVHFYKICDNEDLDSKKSTDSNFDCIYHRIKNDSGNLISSSKSKFSIEIPKTNKTIYVVVADLFGTTKSVKISGKDLK